MLKERGAFVPATVDEAVAGLKEACGGRRPDGIIDFTGQPSVIEKSVEALNVVRHVPHRAPYIVTLTSCREESSALCSIEACRGLGELIGLTSLLNSQCLMSDGPGVVQ